MVQVLVSNREYNVTVDAFNSQGDVVFAHSVNDQSFMEAAEYARQAIGYFGFAMLDHADWAFVQVEINSSLNSIEVIEIGDRPAT